MKRRNRRPLPLPLLAAELMFYSSETMARRMAMMAQGRCSPAEYQRMVTEKALAAWRSGLVLATGSSRRRGLAAALAPWHRGAAANARRLRKR